MNFSIRTWLEFATLPFASFEEGMSIVRTLSQPWTSRVPTSPCFFRVVPGAVADDDRVGAHALGDDHARQNLPAAALHLHDVARGDAELLRGVGVHPHGFAVLDVREVVGFGRIQLGVEAVAALARQSANG